MRYSTLVRNTTLAFALVCSCLTATAASPPSPIAQFQDQLRWQPPPPPPTLGEPGGRGQGGGQRGDCKKYRFVTPLVARSKAGIRWGQTIAKQPNLWVYGPSGFMQDLPVEIRVINQQGETIAKRRTRTQATPAGIISVPFPELPLGEVHWWELAVYCDAEFPDVPVIQRGLIQRIAPSSAMTQTLATIPDPITKANFYAAKGLWFDALETIGNGNIAALTRSELLADLFKQSDLSGFVTAPLRN
ncbi:DUF928 domain-containing protein [filamentous cyanobacterium LEGE 11480]|uniref:DUF928 domain-containing protein n=1 Tax=Romeriopsis navalis LEGE 11480 TaxID=2777977 RepID=A0A928VJ59_9CYAN|nr:DUF928 domain-containing protein [Romeriopsis navalis]MBE9029593.1 DUF928 domain-containing protein [Romeriopsis navalis LEGE 11480]